MFCLQPIKFKKKLNYLKRTNIFDFNLHVSHLLELNNEIPFHIIHIFTIHIHIVINVLISMINKN